MTDAPDDARLQLLDEVLAERYGQPVRTDRPRPTEPVRIPGRAA